MNEQKTNVVDFTGIRLDKQLNILTPEQQLKLHTIQQVFDQEKLSEMLIIAFEKSHTMGEGIDLIFSYVAKFIYGEGGK